MQAQPISVKNVEHDSWLKTKAQNVSTITLMYPMKRTGAYSATVSGEATCEQKTK